VYVTPNTPATATAAVNTAVTLTITGAAGQSIRITALSASYNAAPTGGTLTVVVNAVTILQLDITAAGPLSVPLPDGGLLCQAGQNAVITLTAAGAAVTGRLNVASFTR
jgi:hypothetical protein